MARSQQTKLLSTKRQRIVPAHGNLTTPPLKHPVQPPPIALPVLSRMPLTTRPGPPAKTPIVHPGFFHINTHGNIVRNSAPGRYPTRTPQANAHKGQFQGGMVKFGNPVQPYTTTAYAHAHVGSIKVRGTNSAALSPPTYPGNQRRRGPQPIYTPMPYNRPIQFGGQASLPRYRRRRL